MHHRKPYQILPSTTQDLIEGYADWVQRYIEEGWAPYILTLMFHHVPGEHQRAKIMVDEVNRVYWILARQIRRKISSKGGRINLPKLLILPDYPVYKEEKQSLKHVAINDGRHMQGLLLVPPENRLKKGLEWHLVDEQHRYRWPDRPLKLIHAKFVDQTPREVVDYVLKALKTGRSSHDEILLLP